jgi:hypothetical protein
MNQLETKLLTNTKSMKLLHTSPTTNNSKGRSFLRPAPFLIPIALACFALLGPKAFGLVPPPDGGYPGFNTAEGQNALLSLSTGVGNTAVGWFSLKSNTDGSFNTAVGAGTLLLNIGDQSTGDGVENTAVGTAALLFNTTGYQNTAVGTQALFSNTEADGNTATGYQALISNTTGNYNTANGYRALYSNTGGGSNTAVGAEALVSNTTGTVNTALGVGAGASLTTGDFNIDIGNPGVAGESRTIRIGDALVQTRTFIAAIRGVTSGVADAVPVLIDSAGQLGTASSSRRFKHEIKPMDKASESILALKPVTFHYKSDTTGTPQFGLIAEDVAEVNPDLVVRDANREIYTVRYDAVNAMLLNEFLKEHNKVQEQGASITELKKEIEALTATVKQQAAQIQKVSAQVDATKPLPHLVLNNP